MVFRRKPCRRRGQLGCLCKCWHAPVQYRDCQSGACRYVADSRDHESLIVILKAYQTQPARSPAGGCAHNTRYQASPASCPHAARPRPRCVRRPHDTNARTVAPLTHWTFGAMRSRRSCRFATSSCRMARARLRGRSRWSGASSWSSGSWRRRVALHLLRAAPSRTTDMAGRSPCTSRFYALRGHY